MARYTSKQTTVTFLDNAGTSITAGPGPGDFKCSNFEADNSEAISVKNRGVHDGWVEGDDLEQDWSITLGLKNETITSASVARIGDWIRKANFFSGLQSVDSNVWAFKVQIQMVSNAITSTITLLNNRVKFDKQEAKDGWTISVSGKNVGGYTITAS